MSDLATVDDIFKGLPRRIHVGALTFRVVIGSEESHPVLTDCWGCCDFEGCRIYLLESMDAQHVLNTVLHEVTHAINWVYGITDDSNEETFTAQHTNGLIDVWLRNPRLHNWIVKNVRRMKKEANHD